ncbi:MAG: hypothetical protein J6B77_02410 [Clostridia bacterium]|nr:hypothetical protein [Clostridia bacterium]
MMFKRIKWLKKPNKEAEEQLHEDRANEGGLDKKDLPAMILSAMIIFIPVALVVLVALCLISWLFFF